MDDELSVSRSDPSRCLVNAGQIGPLQQKIPCFSLKSCTVLDFLGICSYFMDLKGEFNLPSIYYGSDRDIYEIY
jgi:hypothetical protein